jgi:hypothetical protein
MTKIADINYQPLIALKGSPSSAGMSYKDSLHGKMLLTWVALIGGVLLSIVIIVLNQKLVGLAVGIMVVSTLPIGISISIKMNSEELKAWLQFATVNNWYIDSTLSAEQLLPVGLSPRNNGVIFQNNLIRLPVIKAVVGSVTCELFNTYSNCLGSSMLVGVVGNRSTYCLIARTTLTDALPRMVIRSTSEFVPWIAQDESWTDTQTLQLGGDFDHFFKVDVPADQVATVQQLLTPSLMQSLVQLAQTTPLQIITTGTELYVINNNLFHAVNYKFAQQLLMATAQIVDTMKPSSMPTNG